MSGTGVHVRPACCPQTEKKNNPVRKAKGTNDDLLLESAECIDKRTVRSNP